jgi:hypothetical protein
VNAPFHEILVEYGGDPAAVLSLRQDGPDILPYLALTSARDTSETELNTLIGVYEWNHRPLMFMADGETLRAREIFRLRRLLAMRGDAQYLGVFLRGSLHVYPIGLDGDDELAGPASLEFNEKHRQAVFPHLINVRPQVASGRGWIGDVLLRLLSGSLDALIKFGSSDEDAISLVGRALFLRFLADRDLLRSSTIAKISGDVGQLLDNAKSARLASEWLDKTFNGDFLPLGDGTFEGLKPEAFGVLTDILRKAPDGQLSLPWVERWAMLDFAHIPVGVLSQTYERYLSRHEPKKQRKEGGYYTPRHIADLLVRGSFQALRRDGVAHQAKVLDPSAGAGVFLVTAFRQIVEERWRHDGRRPDTKVLRSILFKCIRGFDINEAALRFAALGLYLASIELDPNPEPLPKLKFANLRPTVLVNFGRSEDELKQSPGDLLGSLGTLVGSEHLGAYDLVVGNPPWATSTRIPGWQEVVKRVAAIAKTRIKDPLISAPVPNDVLDLPFIWRAMEWARPGGQIAFALHARLLFQRGETMPQARAALFAAIDVTSIINGTELRRTRVWPEITAPFCLLFARNNVPPPGAAFSFISPRLDLSMNRSGAWRMDVSNSEIVSSETVRHRPEILKILFRGGRLDLEIYDRVKARAHPALGDYWRSTFGDAEGRPKYTGNGYQRIRASSRVRKRDTDGLPGVNASYLRGLPDIDGPIESTLIDGSQLPLFDQARIHDPRPIDLFTGPLFLVRESPSISMSRMHVNVSSRTAVFNQSYHGYSAASHSNGEALVKYLSLVVGSQFAIWHALITSGRFGFERDVVEKFVIDELPIIPLESLSASQIGSVDKLFSTIATVRNAEAWRPIDKWVGGLYGLSESDIQVITDTLRFGLPFSQNQAAATAPPSSTDLSTFLKRLKQDLSTWLTGLSISTKFVAEAKSPPLSPWSFIRIGFGADANDAKDLPSERWNEVINAADEVSASEIIFHDERYQELWVGRLNQARYWSDSQARILARTIIWDHAEIVTASGVGRNN